MNPLLLPTSTLSALQRKLVWLISLLVAASRVYGMSETLWDWDEAQFALGLTEFDVANHHPHPPGFPVYMALANFARLFVASDFAALQCVTLAGACALFPLAFLLAREMRFSFETSLLGALLFVFLPNVWFFGGTGFSDIPGLAWTLAAAGMLLRGCRDRRAYLLGAVLLGLAAGTRPQALLIGLGPLAVASWIQLRQSWRRVIAAAVLLTITVLGCYIGAAVASASIDMYQSRVRDVGLWVRTHDAISAEGRPALRTLLDDFFVTAMGGGRLGIVVSALAALGALRGFRRDQLSAGLAVLTFLPFAVVASLSLDPNSIHRYSTAYLCLWTLLAAHALAPIGFWPRGAQVVILLLITGRYAWWTGIALREVRESPSPTYAAFVWLRDHVPQGQRVWVHGSLNPLGQHLLPDHELKLVNSLTEVTHQGRPDEYFVAEGGAIDKAAIVFARGRDRVWDIARQRYFEVTVIPVADLIAFAEGWHDEESSRDSQWRWMSGTGEIFMCRMEGKARLTLTLEAARGIQPLIEASMNGVVIDRFRCEDAPVKREWVVNLRPDAPNRLVLRSSHTLNPKKLGISEDSREMSIMLTEIRSELVR